MLDRLHIFSRLYNRIADRELFKRYIRYGMIMQKKYKFVLREFLFFTLLPFFIY